MFPTSFEGTLELPNITAQNLETAFRSMDSALRAVRASDIFRDGNRISFRAGIFRFVSNWNILVPVGSGWIQIEPGNIYYSFSCMELLVITTVMVTLMSTAVAMVGDASSSEVFGLFILGWAWLFGMNYLIGLFRLPRFIERSVSVPKDRLTNRLN